MNHALITALNSRRATLDAEISVQIAESRKAGTRATTIALIKRRAFFWCAFSARMHAVFLGA